MKRKNNLDSSQTNDNSNLSEPAVKRQNISEVEIIPDNVFQSFADLILHNYLKLLNEGNYEQIKKELGTVDIQTKDTLLLISACYNHHVIINDLIAVGANVNKANNNGAFPLLMAANKGHSDIVKALLEAGADVNQVSKIGQFSLLTAAQKGHTHVVKILLEAGAKVDQVDEIGNFPLLVAALNNYTDIVKVLLEYGADVNKANDFGQFPLLVAATDVIKVLLEAGAKVDQVNTENGEFPLLVAATKGHTDVVKILLEAGAKVDQVDTEDGEFPLLLAAQTGHTDVIKALLEADAKVDQVDTGNGDSPLMKAASNGHTDVVKALLEYGADINQVNTETGEFPLLLAAQTGHTDVVKALLEYGADINQANIENGEFPLLLAAQNGHTDVVKALLEADAKVDQANTKNGEFPLMKAAFNGHTDVVKILLEADAKVDQANTKNGEFPLMKAAFNGHTDVVKILLEAGAEQNELFTKISKADYSQDMNNDLNYEEKQAKIHAENLKLLLSMDKIDLSKIPSDISADDILFAEFKLQITIGRILQQVSNSNSVEMPDIVQQLQAMYAASGEAFTIHQQLSFSFTESNLFHPDNFNFDDFDDYYDSVTMEKTAGEVLTNALLAQLDAAVRASPVMINYAVANLLQLENANMISLPSASICLSASDGDEHNNHSKMVDENHSAVEGHVYGFVKLANSYNPLGILRVVAQLDSKHWQLLIQSKPDLVETLTADIVAHLQDHGYGVDNHQSSEDGLNSYLTEFKADVESPRYEIVSDILNAVAYKCNNLQDIIIGQFIRKLIAVTTSIDNAAASHHEDKQQPTTAISNNNNDIIADDNNSGHGSHGSHGSHSNHINATTTDQAQPLHHGLQLLLQSYGLLDAACHLKDVEAFKKHCEAVAAYKPVLSVGAQRMQFSKAKDKVTELLDQLCLTEELYLTEQIISDDMQNGLSAFAENNTLAVIGESSIC